MAAPTNSRSLVERASEGTPVPSEHTAVPNLLMDMIIPLVSEGAARCLLYISRRTYGFCSTTNPRMRKSWDRISISQFVDGCSAGDRIKMDLGTGMSRQTVIDNLKWLEDKNLVRVAYECAQKIEHGKYKGCGWFEGSETGGHPVIDAKGVKHCPRCKRTLDKAYSLAVLTPKLVVAFLNDADRAGNTWVYDHETKRFCVTTPSPQRAAAATKTAKDKQKTESKRQAQLDRIQQLRTQIWFPDKLDVIISHAAALNKDKKISTGRQLNGFYEPTLRLQQEGFAREQLAYALDEVIKRGIAGSRRRNSWDAYAAAVAKSAIERAARGTKNAGQTATQTLQASQIDEVLRTCAEHNSAGRHDQARALLADLLSSHLVAASEHKEGDTAVTRRCILHAFKGGLDDWQFAFDYNTFVDYLPEWNWEDDEAQARAQTSPPA